VSPPSKCEGRLSESDQGIKETGAALGRCYPRGAAVPAVCRSRRDGTARHARIPSRFLNRTGSFDVLPDFLEIAVPA
jgi:hypothetical protein